MITLYAGPGACSLVPHIIIHELNLPYTLKLAKWGDQETWGKIRELNKMGQVPTMITEEGYTLTEVTAILQYLIAQKPNDLFPMYGKLRFQAFEWLNFIATSLHRNFAPLFGPAKFTDTPSHEESVIRQAHSNLQKILAVAEERFSNDGFALGSNFTIVDAYLFVILTWAGYKQVPMDGFPKLAKFVETMKKRPSVMAALKAEGLGG